MAISRIKVANFKSFDELDLELRPLNVVVGANAAGKSNFLEIFRFLRDLAEHGLADAVSRQGGMEFLYRRGGTGPLRVEVELEVPREPVADASGLQVVQLFTTDYALSLGPSSSGSLEVIHERLSLRWGDGERVKLERSADGEVHAAAEFPLKYEFLSNKTTEIGRIRLAGDESLVSQKGLGFPQLLAEAAFFDFDPKLPKQAVPVSGSSRLAHDGGNLALVLRNLLQDEEKREDFLLLLKSVLPFARNVRVDGFTARHLLLALEESYAPGYLPASFLSDGTIQVIALILALYFQRHGLILIEEPERNLHPHLISQVVSLMRDAARSRQIIATTHNPELVKHTELADLLLVHRDEQGRSRILRPAESQEVQIFLESDLGVEDLYVQNLLSFGHAI